MSTVNVFSFWFKLAQKEDFDQSVQRETARQSNHSVNCGFESVLFVLTIGVGIHTSKLVQSDVFYLSDWQKMYLPWKDYSGPG